MKRRYKEGDWFRVSLGGEFDALGLIARADRSRLFGYFFAVERVRVLEAVHLKELRPQDAVAAVYFGGSGLETQRWTTIATSLLFERGEWPCPQPAGGRYATPEQLEAELRARITGEAPAEPLLIYQLRSPIDARNLQVLADGGRAQFSEPLDESDLDLLAQFVRKHRGVELRVHGRWRDGFSARALLRFSELRSLVLDCSRLLDAEPLGSLEQLGSLKIGPTEGTLSLAALGALPHLRVLELRGPNADVGSLADLAALEVLTLVDTPPAPLGAAAARARIRTLTLAHGRYDLDAAARMDALECLDLRDMRLANLPDFAGNLRLRRIALRRIRGLRDLSALTRAPQLAELIIEGMPQLEVPDFEPLTAFARLPALSIDIGSRTKSREAYRLLRRRSLQ